MTEIANSHNYLQILESIKEQVKSSQLKAHFSVNKEMLMLYWKIGATIVEKQAAEGWGTKITRRLSGDLVKSFPNMKGFSYTNLRYMQRFFENYPDLLICHQLGGKLGSKNEQDSNAAICHQAGGKLENAIFYSDYANVILGIPWRHNVAILDKIDEKKKRLWYAEQTIKHGWSRSVLEHQIRKNLYDRQAVKDIKTNNFDFTLPKDGSDLAREIFKDTYNLEFVDNAEGDLQERQLEDALMDEIIKFLTELGKGFAFVGKQYHLEVDEDDYYIDLLFYHLELRCYIVIDLKTTKFRAEYAGKMALYISEVDETLKKETDNNSIGVILCPDSKNKKVRQVINYITKPMSVAGYQLAGDQPKIPEELRPIEDLERILTKTI